MSVSVCVSARAYLKNHTSKPHTMFCVTVAVSRSFCEDICGTMWPIFNFCGRCPWPSLGPPSAALQNAICYVLPVLGEIVSDDETIWPNAVVSPAAGRPNEFIPGLIEACRTYSRDTLLAFFPYYNRTTLPTLNPLSTALPRSWLRRRFFWRQFDLSSKFFHLLYG